MVGAVMKLTTSQKIIVGFAVALVPLLITAWYGFQVPRQFVEFGKTYRQSLQILERIARFQAHLDDAETGQRGFLLTGDERYLELYLQVRNAVGSDVTE